jgi:hypothetical protein
MWAFRLKAGRRIRKGSAVTNLQFVTRACAAVGAPSKVSTGLGSEGISFVVRHHRKLFGLRRPNAKVRFVFADNLRSYRITPLHSGVFSSGHRAMVVFDLASPVKLVRPK